MCFNNAFPESRKRIKGNVGALEGIAEKVLEENTHKRAEKKTPPGIGMKMGPRQE